MEQLTPGEWARDQLRRAPSFAISTAIVAALLLLSTFIQYSAARPKPPRINPMEAEIAKEEPPPIEEIKERIDPKKPELDPVAPAPPVDDPNAVPVDAPLEDNVTLDVPFTEDVESDAPEAADPFPMELTKKMAVIGTGPGTGGFRGVLGNRTPAGRRRAAGRFGMPKGTDKDILAALRWLARVQNKQTGGWDDPKYAPRSRARGVSGLALLAFLGYGCTDKTPREFVPVVKRAITYLIKSQVREEGAVEGKEAWRNKDGSFGERMYTQGICTMALAEAYAMMGGKQIKEAAQAGLNYILRKQPAYGSFGYTGSGTDTSVTGFQMQAIKAGIVAGLDVPDSSRKKTENWLEKNMAGNYSTPYRTNQKAKVQRNGSPTMTAASLTARLFLGHKRTASDCVGQAEYLTKNDAHVKVGQTANNLYHVYYMCLSMFNMGGKYWKTWNPAFNGPLRAKQEKAGPEKGSWPTRGMKYGGHGGRVYTTSMACLALEVYFRFLPTYKSF